MNKNLYGIAKKRERLIKKAVQKYADLPLDGFVKGSLKLIGYGASKLKHLHIGDLRNFPFSDMQAFGCRTDEDGSYVTYVIGDRGPDERFYRDPADFLRTLCELIDLTADAMKLGKPAPQGYPVRTLEEVMNLKDDEGKFIGAKSVRHDVSLKQWVLTVQLDENWEWFLSVFIPEDGREVYYSLDQELADDSHYHFNDEAGVRKELCRENENDKYLDEIFIRVASESGAGFLLSRIRKFITEQFHFYDDD